MWAEIGRSGMSGRRCSGKWRRFWRRRIADSNLTDRVIAQSRAQVRAIEGGTEIEPSGWFERFIAGLLLAAYKRRLRGIIGEAPTWVGEEILSASQRIGSDRAVLWMSEN